MTMVRSFLALIALVCGVPAAGAQAATWHGLHFGETRDQVRAELKAQNIPVETSQEGSLQSTSDYDLFLPSLRYTLPLLSSYHFAPDDGLMDVTLTLDLTAMRQNWGSLGSDDALLHFAAEHLAEGLAGRYGAPLYRSSACDTESKDAAALCVLFWSGPDQSIVLEHIPTPHGQRLLIRYQMLSTDL